MILPEDQFSNEIRLPVPIQMLFALCDTPCLYFHPDEWINFLFDDVNRLFGTCSTKQSATSRHVSPRFANDYALGVSDVFLFFTACKNSHDLRRLMTALKNNYEYVYKLISEESMFVSKS
ncbi:hypothetical protein CEXT_646981 [Caerostris extrusa]|uniref:Uncharacterized protein n=1 Tax=Caerostris extrusa TaxID=172846 RepID=A0AAV4U670_CAEEX|nr:hypothetical protein CEXT_646981 [Caerostris extrusa]